MSMFINNENQIEEKYRIGTRIFITNEELKNDYCNTGVICNKELACDDSIRFIIKLDNGKFISIKDTDYEIDTPFINHNLIDKILLEKLKSKIDVKVVESPKFDIDCGDYKKFYEVPCYERIPIIPFEDTIDKYAEEHFKNVKFIYLYSILTGADLYMNYEKIQKMQPQLYLNSDEFNYILIRYTRDY